MELYKMKTNHMRFFVDYYIIENIGVSSRAYASDESNQRGVNVPLYAPDFNSKQYVSAPDEKSSHVGHSLFKLLAPTPFLLCSKGRICLMGEAPDKNISGTPQT
jgi:hypothetical protein